MEQMRSAKSVPIETGRATKARGRMSRSRITGLAIEYLVLGFASMGIAGIAVWFFDPCGPFYPSSADSPYVDATDTAMGFGMFGYLAALIPMWFLRKRAIVWWIPPLVAVAVTVLAIWMIAGAVENPANTCDITQ